MPTPQEFTEVPLGPCQLVFKGVDLGYTDESTVFRFSEADADINLSQWGTTPTDKIVTGLTAELETSLTRVAIAKLSSLISGANNSLTSGDDILVKSVVGVSRYDSSGLLIIKPLIGANTPNPNPKSWTRLYKAAPILDGEVSYDNATQRVVGFTFVAFPWIDKSGPGRGALWGNVEIA